MGHGPGPYVALMFLVGGCLDQEGAFVIADDEAFAYEHGMAPATGMMPIGLGNDEEGADCWCLDMEDANGGVPLGAGTPIDGTQKWNALGVHLVNQDPDHPAIRFDSANPTGGDYDLETPAANAPGRELDHVLILAENTVDANQDGIIDVPDDNADGGVIEIEFDSMWCLISVETVDVGDDEAAATITVLNSTDPNTPLYEAELGGMADNAWDLHTVQDSVWDGCDMHTLRIELYGSGAVDRLSGCRGGLDPEPEQDRRCL